MTGVDDGAQPTRLSTFNMRPSTEYPGKIEKPWREFQPSMVPQVTENPESQFKQAWQLAKDDSRMRARMVAWLNDQLRDAEVGDISDG
jgi:hypothetical protein